MDPTESANPVKPGGNNVVFVFGYTGAYTDVVTADQLDSVRWYNPATQRWISQDPIESGTNWDEYCDNGPTDGTDPSGLWPIIPWYNGTYTHELLSRDAAEAAGYDILVPDIDMHADTAFVSGIENGVASVDNPESLWALSWVKAYGKGRYTRAEAFKNAPLSMETHYGDWAFHHGMTPYDEQGNKLAWDAQKMQTEIVGWIVQQYTVALGDKDNSYGQGFDIGQALHTLEDLYSPAHVQRDPVTGAITRFQDYNSQDPSKHEHGDDATEHMAEWNVALAAATQLLKYLKAGTPAAAVQKWLTDAGGPVAIAPGAVKWWFGGRVRS